MQALPDEDVIRVAVAQFDAEPRAIERNTGRALEAVHEAARRDAALVVLPEGCLGGYDLDWVREGLPGGGTALDGEPRDELAHVGSELGVGIVVNDLERYGDALFSTTVVLADGREIARYRKTHVTAKEQAAGLAAGDRRAPVLQLPGLPLPVAPMICFEHGFPEIALTLALDGAGLLAMSSAIGRGHEYLRNLRTRARAQDNGVYALAANLVGHGYCGESMIVDPHGDVVARASGDADDVLVVAADARLVSSQRDAEPVLARRRPELYRNR